MLVNKISLKANRIHQPAWNSISSGKDFPPFLFLWNIQGVLLSTLRDFFFFLFHLFLSPTHFCQNTTIHYIHTLTHSLVLITHNDSKSHNWFVFHKLKYSTSICHFLQKQQETFKVHKIIIKIKKKYFFIICYFLTSSIPFILSSWLFSITQIYLLLY